MEVAVAMVRLVANHGRVWMLHFLFDSADSRKPLKVSELKKKVKSVFQEALPGKRVSLGLE